MRILMVSDVYFPRVNGVSTSIETFRKTLVGQGVEVRLVVPRYGDEPDEPGIVRVAGRPVPGDPEDRLVGWRAMHRTVLEAAQDCDLIHIQTPFIAQYAGLKAARTLGLPVVATYHTLFEEYLQHYAPFLPSGWLKGQARALSRRQCNALDAVIVPSTAMQQRLNSYGVTVPLHVLPTGIPLAQFAGGNGQAFRYQHGILSTRPLALFVGRVAHEKNIGFLLEALVHARQLRPDVLLVVAGEGPAMDDLKAQVKSLGLRDSVQFIGYLDRKQALPDCYAAADAFVFCLAYRNAGPGAAGGDGRRFAGDRPVRNGDDGYSFARPWCHFTPGRGQGFWRNAGQFSESAQRLAPSAPGSPGVRAGMVGCGDGGTFGLPLPRTGGP
jgi:1,2-diacylglycerol 3-alpha-glucosyltransferase